jgi:hypothetical protein
MKKMFLSSVVLSKYLDISPHQISPVATVKFLAGAENYKLSIVKKWWKHYTTLFVCQKVTMSAA